MKHFFIFVWLIIPLIVGCNRSTASQDSATVVEETKSLKLIAQEKLGEGVKMEEKGNWVLCSKSLDQRQTVYFVFDQSTEEVVYEEGNPVRSVEWRSDYELLIRPYERVFSETNNDYIIELPSGTRKQLTNIK